MMDWIKVILSILFCILYPIFWLVQGLLSVLGALLTPFLHLGSYAIHLTILPFRVLAKLEVSDHVSSSVSNRHPRSLYLA